MKQRTKLWISIIVGVLVLIAAGGYLFGFDTLKFWKSSASTVTNENTSIAITADKTDARVGDTVKYTVTLINTLDKVANNVQVKYSLANGKGFVNKKIKVTLVPKETITFTIPITILDDEATKTTSEAYFAVGGFFTKKGVASSVTISLLKAKIVANYNFKSVQKASSKATDVLSTETKRKEVKTKDASGALIVDTNDAVLGDIVLKNDSNKALTINCPIISELFGNNLKGPALSPTNLNKAICGTDGKANLEFKANETKTIPVTILFANAQKYFNATTNKYVWSANLDKTIFPNPDQIFWYNIGTTAPAGPFRINVQSSEGIDKYHSFAVDLPVMKFSLTDSGDDSLIPAPIVAANWSSTLAFDSIVKASGNDNFLGENTERATRRIADVTSNGAINADSNDTLKGTLTIKNQTAAIQKIDFTSGCQVPTVLLAGIRGFRPSSQTCLTAITFMEFAPNETKTFPVNIALADFQNYQNANGALPVFNDKFKEAIGFDPYNSYWFTPVPGLFDLTASLGAKSNTIKVRYTYEGEY